MNADPAEPKPDHDEPWNDADYQRFVESMVPHCRCARDRPCDGVLAGGLCDDVQEEDSRDEDLE